MKSICRTAPLAFGLALVGLPLSSPGAVNVYLTEVPNYSWDYGCMGTASGNLIGFWDRHGFPDFYTGPLNGGLAPLNSSSTNHAISSLWATKAGVDGRPSDRPGHVDDYYLEYENTASDPWLAAGRAEHEPDCIGDFIGLNQFKWQNLRNECRGNIDGFCFVSWDPAGERRINHVPDPAASEPDVDVQTGLRAWARWRGCEADVFTQLTDFNPNVAVGKGFTFADMKAEIDAGYPVLLFLQRYGELSRTVGAAENVNPPIHSMLAFGYYIANGLNYVRYRTSWADGDARMHVWNAHIWEADLPVRGVIGFRPSPRIRQFSFQDGDLSLAWDGPTADLYDASLGTKRVHGYIVEMASSCAAPVFQPVSSTLLTNRFTITNCPSPAFVRLQLVRP